MKVLVDNGHGAETPGKRSPDGRLREYLWARRCASRVVAGLRSAGVDAVLLVPEERDVALAERTRRANAECRSLGAGNVLLVSIHCNAAGDGTKWMTARGWSAHVSMNASGKSKLLAISLAESALSAGLRVRKWTATVPYWPQDLAICRDTLCPAVLTENLFMDNRSDASFLLSEEGSEVLAGLHVSGITGFINSSD